MSQRAITGLGIQCAGGRDEQAYRTSIREGTCRVQRLDNARVPSNQTAVGLPIEGLASTPDRALHLLYEAVAQALEGAELKPSQNTELPLEMAIITGTSLGVIDSTIESHRVAIAQGTSADSIQQHQPECLARHLAEQFGIIGPRLSLSCACTSATSALGIACDWLDTGRISRCLVAGVDTLNDFVLCGFSSLWALTGNEPRPFDKSRDGMALGEAAAALILERVEEPSRIRAILAGYGASGDAVHITAPDRTGAGAARAMEYALSDADWTPEQVEYVNVHATGSVFNDSMILGAIDTVFGTNERELPISSVNPVTGHTLGVAGLLEVVATILAMEAQFIPPTPNLHDPERQGISLVMGHAIERSYHKALSLTTGFGGANTAIALERPVMDYQEPKP